MNRVPSAVSDPSAVTVIRPSGGWVSFELAGLWQYRELLYFLTWRDVKVRYKQTVLGVLWVVIQPFFTMLLFTILFGRLAKVPSDGFPYPLFSYCALLPWQLFAHALAESANSLVANERLVTKVYFPRLVIPLASVLSGLADFLVSLGVFAVLMWYYGVRPSLAMVAAPVFVVLALMTALAVGLWLSALNVQYRDVRYTIPFLTQFWLLATPVAYPASLVPEGWRLLYGFNPMAGVVEGMRWSLLGGGVFPGSIAAVSVGVVVVLLVTGLAYFRRMERVFADVI